MYKYDVNTETCRIIANTATEALFSIDKSEIKVDTILDQFIYLLVEQGLDGDKSAIMSLFALATDPTASNSCDSDKDCHCYDEEYYSDEEEISGPNIEDLDLNNPKDAEAAFNNIKIWRVLSETYKYDPFTKTLIKKLKTVDFDTDENYGTKEEDFQDIEEVR
jgi:hypothetical protein